MRSPRAALASLMVLLVLPLQAQTVQEQMLVSAEWLRPRLGTVTLLHIGDAAEYDAGHIPGAVLVEMTSLLTQRGSTPNELPPADTLERVFRLAGVGTRGRIVIYSANPLYAARAWFTLDSLGQAARTSLLDGGLTQWVASGHETSTVRVHPKPGMFEARPVPQTVTRLATMRELVKRRWQLGPNLVLIDARPAAQFYGEEAGADVLHAGHIPGAVNLPSSMTVAADGTFRSAAELRAQLEDAGVTGKSVNIVYCRTGMQASITYFVLKYLGYDASLYDGSFLEWSNSGEMTWSG